MTNRRIKTTSQLFCEYLIATRLTHLPKTSVQYQETKKAFISGAALMFDRMTIDLCKLDDEQAIKEIDKMQNELITLIKEIAD